jgi:hypothetical protein
MHLNIQVLESLKMTDHQTVEVKFDKGVIVNKEDMRSILNALYELTNNQPCKRLIVISKGSHLEHAARIYLQEENKARKIAIIAEAVLVTSLTQKMTTNFYLKFIKDIYPSKFFTDIDKAKFWLDQY